MYPPALESAYKITINTSRPIIHLYQGVPDYMLKEWSGVQLSQDEF